MQVNPPRHLRAITIGLLLAAVACSSETKPNFDIPPQPDGLTILPENATVEAGYQPVQLTLQLRKAGAVSYVPASSATWTSDATTVATVDATGALTGLSPGTANIGATYAGYTATKAVGVTPAVKYVQFSPVVPTVGTGDGAIPVTAVAVYDDNTVRDVTSAATFSVRPATPSGTATATVSGNNITAIAAGSSVLDAQYHGRTFSAPVVTTVTQPPPTPGTLQSIAITTTPPAVPFAKLQKFKVQAQTTYSDGTHTQTNDGTLAGATFISDNENVLTFSGNTATAVAAGTANVTVEYVEGTTKVTSAPVAFTISDANLVSFVITVAGAPATSMTLALDSSGEAKGLHAQGTYDDGNTRDITRTVKWTIANKAKTDDGVHADLTTGATVFVGAVTPPANDPAQYTPGIATVTATYTPGSGDPIEQALDVTVTDAAATFTLNWLDANSDPATLAYGNFAQVQADWATGDSDDVTGRCTFVSTNPAYAAVDTLPGSATFGQLVQIPGGAGPATIQVYFIPTEDSPANAVLHPGWKAFIPVKIAEFTAP